MPAQCQHSASVVGWRGEGAARACGGRDGVNTVSVASLFHATVLLPSATRAAAASHGTKLVSKSVSVRSASALRFRQPTVHAVHSMHKREMRSPAPSMYDCYLFVL